MASRNVAAAEERAREDARAGYRPVPPDGRKRVRELAIGDPQASLERFLTILDLNQLLGAEGRLKPEVGLISMGDHFDWGGREERARGAEDGLALLSWLAAHPPDQVTLIVGNHDLGRVGELVRFDDLSFQAAQREANAVYYDRTEPEAAFLERHPELPTAEILARDFATFRVRQRELVTALLRARRFRVAVGRAGVLFCHAGVTLDDLAMIAVPRESEAAGIAAGLNAALDAAVGAWSDGTPLAMGPLHRPGDARHGEARGIFYHRPGNPAFEDEALYAGPPRRRFDPRRLPLGLTQAIGHIRDDKCRKLLRGWHDGAAPVDGPLRHLVTDGREVRYRRGLPERLEPKAGTMLFLDSGMHYVEDPAEYQLLDVQVLAELVRRGLGQ